MAKVKKIKNKSTITRHPVIIVFLIFAVLLVSLVTYYLLVRSDFAKVEEKESGETTETSEDSDTTGEISDSSDEEISKVTQYEGEDPNKSAELTGMVSYIDAESGTLTVNVTIDQMLTEGTCTLVLTGQTGAEVSFKAEMEPDATATFCQFVEDIKDLASEEWNVEVYLESGDRVGTLTGAVEI